MGNILPPDLVPDPDPAPEPESARDRSLDYALLRDPQLRELFERVDYHLTEARRLQAEIRRAVGTLVGLDNDAEAKVEPHVIIKKDPGRTMRAKLNSVESADGPDEDTVEETPEESEWARRFKIRRAVRKFSESGGPDKDDDTVDYPDPEGNPV